MSNEEPGKSENNYTQSLCELATAIAHLGVMGEQAKCAARAIGDSDRVLAHNQAAAHEAMRALQNIEAAADRLRVFIAWQMAEHGPRIVVA